MIALAPTAASITEAVVATPMLLQTVTTSRYTLAENLVFRGAPALVSFPAYGFSFKSLCLEAYLTNLSGTPILASIVNRINEERLSAGKGPVGFINPVLYANPGVLNDITNGSNPGCGTNGFSAVPGWDPTTGLGTPNFEKVLGLFLGLP